MKGSDNIYYILGKDIATGEDISDEVEEIYIDWIFDAFEHYKQHPPVGCESLDDIAVFITKEFNIRKYIFETGSNKSLSELRTIMKASLDGTKCKEILQKIGKQTPDNDRWVSDVRIFELLKCLDRTEPSKNVAVMHPEINGEYEQNEKRR